MSTHDKIALVDVAEGRLQGDVERGIRRFLGIPYAAAPIGALRWQAPQPARAWDGVRPAITFAASSLQPADPRFSAWCASDCDEDCLYLNVWSPVDARALPVVVVIHGGGFQLGSGSVPVYHGASLASWNLVVVSFNYRLGPLGFAGQNYWLQDQIAALRWVKHNIAAFGGDPNRITIAGISAGAVSVNALVTNSAAAGLFDQAVSVSGGGDLMFSADPHPLAQDAFGPGAAPPVLEAAFPSGAGERPYVDGNLIEQFPSQAVALGRLNVKRWMIGACDYESSIIDGLGIDIEPVAAMARALVSDPDLARQTGDGHSLYTHVFFAAPAQAFADGASAAGVETYLFDYGYVPAALRGRFPGSPHGVAFYALLGNLDAGFAEFGVTPTEEDRRANRAWQSRFVSFVRGEPPDVANAAHWPAHARGGRDTLIVEASGGERIDAPADLKQLASRRAQHKGWQHD